MKLMQNSGVPIYQQIADSFKTDILAGRYEQGEFLPSIRGLAKDLKISVITTMKAYEQLADETHHSGAGQGLLCQCTGQRDDKGTAPAQGGGVADRRDSRG